MALNQGFALTPQPCILTGHGVRLEPLSLAHAEALAHAARDGELWNLRVTSVPEPEQTVSYIQTALDGYEAGHMLPFVVVHADTQEIIGSTRYHDIIASVARLEIGYTWYAKSHQRSFVNTA